MAAKCECKGCGQEGCGLRWGAKKQVMCDYPRKQKGEAAEARRCSQCTCYDCWPHASLDSCGCPPPAQVPAAAAAAAATSAAGRGNAGAGGHGGGGTGGGGTGFGAHGGGGAVAGGGGPAGGGDEGAHQK